MLLRRLAQRRAPIEVADPHRIVHGRATVGEDGVVVHRALRHPELAAASAARRAALTPPKATFALHSDAPEAVKFVRVVSRAMADLTPKPEVEAPRRSIAGGLYVALILAVWGSVYVVAEILAGMRVGS